MGNNHRGTVLQVPAGDSPGLIFVDGRQMPFQLAGVWQSPVAPAVNQVVDVSFDEVGVLTRVAVVDAQALAKERLNQFAGIAGDRGQQAMTKGGAVLHAVVGRMGRGQSIACAALLVAWFFLPVLSVNAGFGIARDFTVLDILGINLSQSGANSNFGFWSFLGLVAVALPWIAPWSRTRWAPLLNAAPLLLLVVAYVRVRWQVHALVSQALDAAGQFGGAEAQEMMQGVMEQMSSRVGDAVSLDFWFWVVLAISLYLAATGAMRFLRRPLPSPIAH